MDEPGTHVAGYRLERVLGQGGMGTVYLARHPVLPRSDALKVLSAELSGAPDFEARFMREADVASSLVHPNIVPIFDRGRTEDGLLWIAMQYVDGTDADEIVRRAAMTPQRAVHVIGEVAGALDFAHARNVVHRDIKPSNFLLSSTTGHDRVMLADFGIARALDDIGLTATGSLTATVAYAAPELLAGRPFDGRADVYSLGCALFKMLTGTTPFEGGQGIAAIMVAHLEQPPPRVTERTPSLPTTLDRVIAIAMAKNPAERYQTAGELAAAAQAALYGNGPTARSPTRPGLEKQRPRRLWRWAAALAAIVALAVIASIAAVQREPGRAAPAAPGRAPATAHDLVRGRDLASMLLTPEQVSATMSAPMTPDPVSYGLDDSTYIMDETRCAATLFPGQIPVYTGSGWTGTAARVLNEMTDRSDPATPLGKNVTQVLVAYPTTDLARRFLEGQARVWAQCANQRVMVAPVPNTPPVPIFFSDLEKTDDTLVMNQNMEGSMGWVCTRALTVRNNVAIDVNGCGVNGAEERTRTLLAELAENIPQ